MISVLMISKRRLPLLLFLFPCVYCWRAFLMKSQSVQEDKSIPFHVVTFSKIGKKTYRMNLVANSETRTGRKPCLYCRETQDYLVNQFHFGNVETSNGSSQDTTRNGNDSYIQFQTKSDARPRMMRNCFSWWSFGDVTFCFHGPKQAQAGRGVRFSWAPGKTFW